MLSKVFDHKVKRETAGVWGYIFGVYKCSERYFIVHNKCQIVGPPLPQRCMYWIILFLLIKVAVKQPLLTKAAEALGANIIKGVCRDDPCECLYLLCEVLNLPFWTSHNALRGQVYQFIFKDGFIRPRSLYSFQAYVHALHRPGRYPQSTKYHVHLIAQATLLISVTNYYSRNNIPE